MIISALIQALFGCCFGMMNDEVWDSDREGDEEGDGDDDEVCKTLKAGCYVSAPTQLMSSQSICCAVLWRFNRDVAMRNSDTIVLHILF